MAKELFSRDTDLAPRISQSFGLGSVFDLSTGASIPSDQGSWTSSPVGRFLLIQAGSPEYYLLIDNTNRLLIE
jgi:hypothetical protein